MKIKIMKSLLSIAILTAMTSGIQAAGTTAGTDIDNRASISYSVSGTLQTAINSSEGGNSDPTACTGASDCQTSFVVDKKVDLNVTSTAGPDTPIVPNGTATHTFTLTNEGNDIEFFTLTSLDATGSDTFDATSCTTTVGATTGTYTDPSTAATTNSTGTPLRLAPDGTALITLSCTAPLVTGGGAALVNNNTADVSLIATATVSNGGAAHSESGSDVAGTKDTVLADALGSATGDIVRDSKHSDIHTYIIKSASLTVTKAQPTVTAMPINGVDEGADTNFHIPGATIEYTITVSNADGAAAARSLSISDTVDITTLENITCSVSGAGPAVADTVYPAAVSAAPITPTCSVVALTGVVSTSSFTLPGGSGAANTQTLTITADIK